MNIATTRGRFGWVRPLGWSVAAGLILAPLIAMQFTREVDWSPGDFVFAALLIGGVGLALELAVRVSVSTSYRLGAVIGLGAGFLLIWSNLAVGYIGNEDNPYNIWFFGVVAVAFGGAVLGTFQARFMAWAMLAAGLTHAVVGAIGFPQDTRTGPITLVFVCLWLGAARLFQKAAREPG